MLRHRPQPIRATASPSVGAAGGRPTQVATGFALRSKVERPGSPYAVSILVTLSFFFGPRGVSTVTTSFLLLPTSALPIGDSFESLCSIGLASAEPTI